MFDKLSELFYSRVLSYDIKKITFTSGTILPDEYCKDLNSLQVVTLPSELEEIGEEAFYDCENLYSIDLGGDTSNQCNLSVRIVAWIMKIIKWIRYIVPILLIMLSVMDFIKAVAADSADEICKTLNSSCINLCLTIITRILTWNI